MVEGLKAIANSIDVSEEGVGGAKSFFEAKMKEQANDKKFEVEIKAEQEKKKKELEEAKIRREAFKQKAATFQ